VVPEAALFVAFFHEIEGEKDVVLIASAVFIEFIYHISLLQSDRKFSDWISRIVVSSSATSYNEILCVSYEFWYLLEGIFN
jgi:hypothetical protein